MSVTSLSDIHCCEAMNYYADPLFREEHSIIRYHPEIRSYNFILHGHDSSFETRIVFCPWCGKKLPKRLIDEMEAVLKNEFGIIEKDWNDPSKIPLEFSTDEWWKKRNL